MFVTVFLLLCVRVRRTLEATPGGSLLLGRRGVDKLLIRDEAIQTLPETCAGEGVALSRPVE